MLVLWLSHVTCLQDLDHTRRSPAFTCSSSAKASLPIAASALCARTCGHNLWPIHTHAPGCQGHVGAWHAVWHHERQACCKACRPAALSWGRAPLQPTRPRQTQPSCESCPCSPRWQASGFVCMAQSTTHQASLCTMTRAPVAEYTRMWTDLERKGVVVGSFAIFVMSASYDTPSVGACI